MDGKLKLISFVIPCYCSEMTVRSVVDEIREEVGRKSSEFGYEIILVNDYSKDGTLNEIKKLTEEDHRIVGIDFPKNFGQASALMAGFREVRGDYVICLDDDGQMPVESIFDLIDKLEEGYDLAFGKYDEIKQKWYRNLGSWMNNKMAEKLIGQPKEVRLSSFCAGKRYIFDEITKYDGNYPYISGLFLRVTKNIANVPVKHRERKYGTSGYTFSKLLGLWLNGFTAFSIIPLRFATFSGLLCSLLGFIFGIVMVIRKILNPDIIMGYTSIVTILLFIGGMIMMMLGIIGEYVGRTYISINRAPQYVVKGKYDNRDKQAVNGNNNERGKMI